MNKRLVTWLFVGGASVLGASPFLMDFLGKWEGEGQQVVYADKLAGGLPTVCKGITKYTSQFPVVVGERWSKEKCRAEEERIVLETQRNLQSCVKAAVPQKLWDMLTSHAHNFGWPTTCSSAIVGEVNAGNFQQACERFAHHPDGRPAWSYAGGQFVRGLYNRRLAERKECLAGLE